jgi:hypothetical protein
MTAYESPPFLAQYRSNSLPVTYTGWPTLTNVQKPRCYGQGVHTCLTRLAARATPSGELPHCRSMMAWAALSPVFSGELGAWVYCLNLLHKLLVPVLRPGEVGKGFGQSRNLGRLRRWSATVCSWTLQGSSGYARASYPTIHFLSRTMPVVRLRKLAAGDLEGHGMGKRPVQSRKCGAYTSASSLRHLHGSCGIHFGNI